MSALDTVFEILKDIRKATDIISRSSLFSAAELIDLTTIYNHINLLIDDDIELLYNRIKLEINNSHKLQELCDMVLGVASALTNLYEKNQDCYNKACSVNSIHQLVWKAAEQQFSLEIRCANEDRLKWQEIVNLLDDSIELKESIYWEPEDNIILERYLEELYDKVGYPIRKENLYPEYQKARTKLKEKESVLVDFNNQKRRKVVELSHQIRENIICLINELVNNLFYCFSEQESDKEGKTDIPKRGRPTNLHKNLGFLRQWR